MKAEIHYVTGIRSTIIENNLSFTDFCLDLFKGRIYLSIIPKENGMSIAINTDNIILVEELESVEREVKLK